MVTKHCLVEFKIGGYRDEILCDVIPMDVCHVFLGRPWQVDRNVIHDGTRNSYHLEKNGRTHMLLLIEEKKVKEEANTSTSIEDLPEEIQELLENFADIVVDELPRSLPPIRSINHQIVLIPGESFLNKATYRLTPQENEEVKK
jgi:hypothetical protein